MRCDLDQAKRLDVGTQYRNDKSAANFAANIAEAERVRIRRTLKTAKFVAGISDGSTDASYQEAEIVYLRSYQSSEIRVYFSLVKNSPKTDADHITKIITEGVSNLASDLNKLVAIGTDGASLETNLVQLTALRTLLSEE